MLCLTNCEQRSLSNVTVKVRHLPPFRAEGMSCRFCGKSFSRKFNLHRHEKEYCSLRDQASEIESETEYNLPMDKKRKYNESDDDTSTTSDDDLQSSEATENESGTEMEDESDPWIPIIEEVQRRHATAYENAKQSFSDNGFDNEAAKEKAYELVLPKLLTEFERASWNVYYG